MGKKICLGFLSLGIIISCQPNPVTDIKPIVSPKTPSIYDYFDKSIKVNEIDFSSLETSNTGDLIDKVKNNSITINVGEIIKFSVYVRYSDGLSDKSFDLTYSDNNVAIIKDNKLIGLKEGKAIVTATPRYEPNNKFNLIITVIPPPKPVTSNTTTPTDNDDKILFLFHSGNSSTGQTSFISTVNSDGTNLKNLSIGSSYNTSPVCSPDSQKFLFQAQSISPSSFSPKGPKSELYVSNANETEELRLSGNFHADDAQWSFDGTKIVFSSNMTSDNYLIEKSEVYLMNADGSNIKKITDNNFYDFNPALSPDGKKIAFISKRDGKNNIYLINVDGSKETKLTEGSFFNITTPQWSPDGTKIAFASDNLFEKNSKIFIVNTDGTEIKQLFDKEDAHDPRWSPDGKKILFQQNWQLNIVNDDGRDLKSFDGIYSFAYQWSHDGEKIVYSSSLSEIFLINSDGSHKTKLLEDDSYKYYFPCWVK